MPTPFLLTDTPSTSAVTGVNDITEADVADEIGDGIAAWRGKDKYGRPCCVVTGE